MLTLKKGIQKYDIYPKIVPINRKVLFTVRALDPAMLAGKYHIDVASVNDSPNFVMFPGIEPSDAPAPLRGLTFSCTLPAEMGYHIRVINNETGKAEVTLVIYALEDDLLRRHPFVGDFHAHTLYSDGRDGPAFVAAEYRQNGFDFLSITDHRRYEPSVMAERAYASLDLPFRIYHGEEVHTPFTYLHLVNFASDVSVNAAALANRELAGWRDKTPDEEWIKKTDELAATLDDVPDGIDPRIIAEAIISSKMIRDGGGMCIFAHPHWLWNVRNAPDSVSRYILEKHICDAFELIGGQSWQENQSQVALYNELRTEGVRIPIVGSSDSHGTLAVNYGSEAEPYCMFTEERTLVFADSNTRSGIISAVSELYSLAVQKFRGQYPYICGGSYRLVQYALFLLEHYYPLRDMLYFEEGRLMHEYSAGTPGAAERLLSTVADNAGFEDKYILR